MFHVTCKRASIWLDITITKQQHQQVTHTWHICPDWVALRRSDIQPQAKLIHPLWILTPLGARTLLGAPGIATRNKKLLGVPPRPTSELSCKGRFRRWSIAVDLRSERLSKRTTLRRGVYSEGSVWYINPLNNSGFLYLFA